MNTQKHTPGPWTAAASGRDDIHNGPVIGSVRGRVAAVVYNGDSEQSNANAQLMAAAPEMYATLVYIRQVMELSRNSADCLNAIDIATAAAITKAQY